MKSFSSSILLECACLYGLRKSARALYELPKTFYLDLAVTWEESTTRTAQPMARHAPQFTPNPYWKLIVTLSGPAISVASLQIGFSGFGFATQRGVKGTPLEESLMSEKTIGSVG